MSRRGHIAVRVEAALRLGPGELRPALLLFLQCLFLVGAFVVGRSVRDTLFLARVSPSALPWVYILCSAAVAAAGTAHARFGAQRRIDVLLPATSLFFAASLVAARFAPPGAGAALPAALYAWVEVMGAITLIQFWSFASVLCNSRQARRAFGLVAGGGTLAGALAGFAVTALARRGGTSLLLLFAAAQLVAAAGLAALTARLAGPRTWSAPRPTRSSRGSARSSGHPHFRALVLLTALTFLSITFIDYQFKVAAAAHFRRDPVELARFFGLVSGVTGLVGVALQFGLIGRILERLGAAGTLALLPASLALGSAWTAAAGSFWAATVSKGAEQGLRYTVTDSATQLLYVPLPPLLRTRFRAAVDGVVRPLTVALAAVLLLVVPPVAGGGLALAALGLCGLWLLSLVSVQRSYLAVLRDALHRGRLHLGAGPRRFDEEAARALRRAFASPDPAEVERALDLAPRGGDRLAASILALLEHPSPRVRAAAVRAMPPEAIPREDLSRALADAAPEVRAAAAAAAFRGGGDVPAAAGVVAGLASSPRPPERALAARALAAAPAPVSRPTLLALLADGDAPVRRAALAAAGERRDAALLPAVVQGLGQPATARAAAAALAAWGPGAEPALDRTLADAGEDPARRRRAASVLGKLASPAAADALQRQVEGAPDDLRGAVARALARAVARGPELAVDRARVDRALAAELALAWRALAAAEALGLPEGGGPLSPDPREQARQLLASALEEKVARAADRSLLLLRILGSSADLELARGRLSDGSPARRAAAVELLDSVLEGGLRRRLVPLLDDRARALRLREAQDLYPLPRLSPGEWLEELLRDRAPWLAAAACHAAGVLGLRSAATALRDLLRHPVPWVREAALLSLGRLLPRGEAAAAARALRADPFEPARRHALLLAGPPPAGSPEPP